MRPAVLESAAVFEGDLILVNAQAPCRQGGAAPALVPLPGTDVLLRPQAARALDALLGEIGGRRAIRAVSGWRSRKEQRELYEQSRRDHGEEYTRSFVAPPGCSEHQTGLAVDLGLPSEHMDLICPEFPYTGICQAFRARSDRFGFVERYPQGKEPVTGIAHEPWHFRYVGAPHAEIMAKQGFTLEEYHEFLRQFPFGGRPYLFASRSGGFAISYLAAGRAADVPLETEPGAPYRVSGNNRDGYILTRRRDPHGR